MSVKVFLQSILLFNSKISSVSLNLCKVLIDLICCWRYNVNTKKGFVTFKERGTSMLRIATCDDNEISRDILCELLEDYEYHNEKADVLSFSMPGELLSAVDDIGFFDLYILDFQMPVMNGVQLAAELRKRGDNGKVIFLSGNRAGAFDAFEVNAFKYLLKPIDRETLFSALNRAIKEKNDEIIQQNKARNTFISNISHEMRTPLTIISSYAQMIQKKMGKYPGAADDSSIKTKLAGISAEALKLSTLVTQMASHSQTLVDKVKNTSIDLNDLETDILHECIPLLTNENSLLLDFDSGLPLISGNADLIIEVLKNLLIFINQQCSNEKLLVRAAVVPEINRVRITVDYTSNGKSTQSLEDIINAGWSTSGGTAIGLTICRDSMRLMGGAMKVNSYSDLHTTVKLTFHN